MIYRIDELAENRINPITKREYDDSWNILMLTDSKDYKQMCGSNNGCAYTIKVSRSNCDDWKMAVGDFIDFCESNNKNAILVMSESDLKTAKKHYTYRSYNEPVLRKNEPSVLIHSTTMNNWIKIKQDGMLKCWNRLKAEKSITEENPIGIHLGDPADFSDYIMFGNGVTGEIVVNSKQQGKIIMNDNTEYLTGARLYFDAQAMAQNGLLVRDGCHLKVKDKLPLDPYLIWTATWDNIGLASQISTPKIFAEQSDKKFQIIAHYNSLIDENNDPVHDPQPLRDYMNKWDGQDFIDKMQLDKTKSVLEIGVGTGRLAIRTAPLCRKYYGIDISPKTIKRAKENLSEQDNVTLICEDFLTYNFSQTFDIIYSSLTFMHIEEKQNALDKVATLLKKDGKFVLSIDKNQDKFIDTGNSKIAVFPDNPEKIKSYLISSELTLTEQYETELAYIFVAKKL